ncbi:MAG TPA: hypothetical protein PLJ33_02630 [Peptococcaceae bacterium]|jgi:hypothetical protein|nr:hypothetical protein [Clostridia bacterium]HOB82631.1 hypothetical protein [Peptococcaceae bacterium]HQD53737.1 hypothetical protein [Peptococcaceae bacterium]
MEDNRTAAFSGVDIIGSGFVLSLLGVFPSVFAGNNLNERLITIGLVLLFYFGLGGVWGLFDPRYFWKGQILFSAPGIILLFGCLLKNFNFYYLIYMLAIFALSSLGGLGGRLVRKYVRKSP